MSNEANTPNNPYAKNIAQKLFWRAQHPDGSLNLSCIHFVVAEDRTYCRWTKGYGKPCHKSIPIGDIYAINASHKPNDPDQSAFCVDCMINAGYCPPAEAVNMDMLDYQKAFLVPITIVSFGYKNEKTAAAQVNLETPVRVIDVRKTLRNPHSDPVLKHLTGLDSAVMNYIRRCPKSEGVFQAIIRQAAGHCTVMIGCHGGVHRSVAAAENLAAKLKSKGVTVVQVIHRDLPVELVREVKL